MSIASYANGTQTASIGTEHFLSSPNAAGRFQMWLDLINMAAGDVLEIRAYKMVLTGGTQRVVYADQITGAQPTDSMIYLSQIIPNVLTDSNAVRFSIKQTYGTGRDFPWSVLNLDNGIPTSFPADILTATAIQDGAITAAKIASDAITAAKIADGAIDGNTFAADTGLKPVRSNTAQSGSTSTTIKLDASASATDNAYRWATVVLTGGTGSGQHGIIVAYNGTTKVATIAGEWTTTPDNTTTFAIVPRGAANVAVSQGRNCLGYFTATTGATTTSIPTSACYPAGAGADQFVGRALIFDNNTATAALRGFPCKVLASSNSATPTFTVRTMPATPASGDFGGIF